MNISKVLISLTGILMACSFASANVACVITDNQKILKSGCVLNLESKKCDYEEVIITSENLSEKITVTYGSNSFDIKPRSYGYAELTTKAEIASGLFVRCANIAAMNK